MRENPRERNTKENEACKSCKNSVLVAFFDDGVQMPDRDESGYLHVCRGKLDAHKFMDDCGFYCALNSLSGHNVQLKEIRCFDRDEIILKGGVPAVDVPIVQVTDEFRAEITSRMAPWDELERRYMNGK